MSSRPSSNRRVVVTGLGILSPVGIDLASSWDGIVNSRSGIGPITHFDASNFATRIAGEVRDFDPARWIAPKEVKKIVVEQLGVKEDEVTNNASFVDDLGADSLDTVELVMALEEEFECEIPDEEAEKITSVQQAIDYVKAHVKA